MTQPSKIRLLIADDHEVVRSGLKSMLEGTEIKVVADVTTGQAAVKYAVENEVDVVLLDVRMPDGDGLTALGRIKLDKPTLPILMFSSLRQSRVHCPGGRLGSQRLSAEGLHPGRVASRSGRRRRVKTSGPAKSFAASPGRWPRHGSPPTSRFP